MKGDHRLKACRPVEIGTDYCTAKQPVRLCKGRKQADGSVAAQAPKPADLKATWDLGVNVHCVTFIEAEDSHRANFATMRTPLGRRHTPMSFSSDVLFRTHPSLENDLHEGTTPADRATLATRVHCWSSNECAKSTRSSRTFDGVPLERTLTFCGEHRTSVANHHHPYQIRPYYGTRWSPVKSTIERCTAHT